MTTTKRDPVAPADDEARLLASTLIGQARHGALATHGQGVHPGISLVALAPFRPGFLTLISGLAAHHPALRANPHAALLLADPGKGDPLAHPRLMLDVTAEFLPKSDDLRQAYLAAQPKAKLYIDFADFDLVHLRATGALLNGGFGKAWRLAAADL